MQFTSFEPWSNRTQLAHLFAHPSQVLVAQIKCCITFKHAMFGSFSPLLQNLQEIQTGQMPNKNIYKTTRGRKYQHMNFQLANTNLATGCKLSDGSLKQETYRRRINHSKKWKERSFTPKPLDLKKQNLVGFTSPGGLHFRKFCGHLDLPHQCMVSSSKKVCLNYLDVKRNHLAVGCSALPLKRPEKKKKKKKKTGSQKKMVPNPSQF